MNTEYGIYSRALAQAQAELAGIRADYERLAKRKAQLEAFIANTEPLIPSIEPSLAFPADPQEVESIYSIQSATLEPMPIWRAITLSINGKSDSFTVRDALDGLDRIGRGIKSKNRFQIVRTALMKKPDAFAKIGTGLYALKNNGREMERATEVAP